MRIPKPKTKETHLQGVTRRQDLRESLANFKKKKKEDETEEYQEPQIAKLDPGTVSKKVIKLIEELDTKFTAATLIMTFQYVSKNAQQNCYDINLPYWFDRYYNEIFIYKTDLIESSFVLEAVMSLFGRRVDNYYSHVSHRAIQNKDTTELIMEAGEGPSTKEKEKKPAAPKGRQLTNKAIGKNDRLYEVDMVPKKFKTLAPSKTTETLQSLNSLEAPKKYFENFNEYKEWRKMYKKKMKNPIPYSIVSEESYINPSMWKLSCIEDFDFDDDKHSKRNYSMFTNYIEHRYSTLVPDINFITHFKVKDFLEAEEDEIEMMKILGLPAPPSRTWPPFCKMSDGGGHRSVDETGRNQDYIQTYIALEDIVLSQESGVENESSRTPLQNERDMRYENLRARINQTCSDNDFEDGFAGFDDCHDEEDLVATVDATLKQIQEETAAPNTDNIVQTEQSELNDKNKADEIQENIPNVDQSTEPAKESNELAGVSEDTQPNPEKHASSTINEETEKNQSEELVPDKTNESCSITDSGYIDENTSKITEDPHRVEENAAKENDEKSAETNSQKEKVSVLSVEVIKPAEGNKDKKEPETTKINEKEPEVVINNPTKDDDDIDEGVWFSEIDEVTRAMFNPVVQLTDICKHIKEKPEEVHFEVDEGLKNMFAIDEAYLRHEEEFKLPLDILVKEPQIELNIFGVPEKMLRKKTNFSLPNEDFETYIKDRKRKQYNTAPATPKVRLYKLNQRFFPSNMEDTPRTSPDFLGFSDSSNDSYDAFKTTEDILSSTMVGNLNDLSSIIEPPNKRPRLSDDSGIALTHSLSIPGSEDLETIAEETDNNGSMEDLRGNNSEKLGDASAVNDAQPSTPDKSLDTTKALSCTLNATENDVSGNCLELRKQSSVIAEDNCVARESDDDDDHFDQAANFQDTSDHQDNSASKNKVLTSDLLCDISASLDEAGIAEKLKDKLVSNNVTGRNEIAKQIQEWHRSLKPILARAHSRHHFDMYDLGTDILQTFDKVGSGVPGDKITLADVMEGKDPTHISRYFLTMLQMTNMQNIKLRANNPVCKKPTPLKNIELVLVSKKRQKISDEDNIGMIRNKKSPRNEEVSNESDLEDDDEFEDLQTFRTDTVEIANNNRGNKSETILAKHKFSNKELLSKEVNTNRDDYMKKLVQKHGLTIKLHDEKQREQSIHMPTCSNSILGEKRQTVDFLYPGNMRSKKIQNAKRLKTNADDLDSGVFSSTTELSLIPE